MRFDLILVNIAFIITCIIVIFFLNFVFNTTYSSTYPSYSTFTNALFNWSMIFFHFEKSKICQCCIINNLSMKFVSWRPFKLLSIIHSRLLLSWFTTSIVHIRVLSFIALIFSIVSQFLWLFYIWLLFNILIVNSINSFPFILMRPFTNILISLHSILIYLLAIVSTLWVNIITLWEWIEIIEQ